MIAESRKITNDVAGENAYGLRGAIDGGLVAAGAQLDDRIDTNAGRAYVYVRQGIFADSFED